MFVASCSGISAADELGVFKWYCDDSEASTFVFSRGFQDAKGLKDLIVASTGLSFNSNHVTVSTNTNGVTCPTFESTSTNTWWTNTLQVLPNLSTASALQVLNTPNQIYTVPEGTNGSTNGYNITADGISVVVLGSDTLAYYGDIAANPIVQVNLGNFTWIEGRFDGTPAVLAFVSTSGVQLGDTMFSRVHNTHVKATDDAGLFLNSAGNNSDNGLFTGIVVEGASISPSINSGGVTVFSGADFNTFHRLRIANTMNGGRSRRSRRK